MKSKTIIGLWAATFLLMTPLVFSEGDHDHGAPEESMLSETTETVEEETGLIYVNNKICPISAEKVGEMGEVIQQEYKGKVYNFCCKMCLKDFNKDPDKYVKMVEMAMDSETLGEEDQEHTEDHSHDHE